MALPAYLALRGGGFDLVAYQQVGLVVWMALALGFVSGALPRARFAPGARPAVLGLTALVAWTALSLAWTESDERTLAELTRVLCYAGVVALAWSTLHRGTWRAAAAGVSVAAGAIVVIGVSSRLFPTWFPASEMDPAFLGQRLAYPLDYWNALAGWSAAAATIALAWSAHALRRDVRALALAVFPVCGLAVYLTYSRGGIVALALGALIVALLGRDRRTIALHALAGLAATVPAVLVARSQTEIANGGGGGDGGGLVALALVLGAIACATIAWTSRPSRHRNGDVGAARARPPGRAIAIAAIAGSVAVLVTLGAISGRSGPADEGLSEYAPAGQLPDPESRLVSLSANRSDLWASAVAAFTSDPALGLGPGSFEFWWGRDGGDEPLVLDAHSLYLETLAELGLPGLLSLLVFGGGALRLALLARRRLGRTREVGAAVAMIAAFGAIAAQAAVDWLWEITALGVLAVASIAVAGAASSRPFRPRTRLSRGRIGFVALCVGACAVQAPGLVSTDRLRASERAMSLGLEGRALELADEAASAAPWAASPRAQGAAVELELDRLAEALEDARAAISREPTNWRHWLLLARIEADTGDTAGAREALDRLAELRPGSAALIEALGDALAPTGGPG